MNEWAVRQQNFILKMGAGPWTRPAGEGEAPAVTANTWGGAGRLCERLWPGGHWLHRPRLLGGQLLQAGLPPVKHLFHAFLLLEDLLHVFLKRQGRWSGQQVP